MALVRPPAVARILWPGLLWRLPAGGRTLHLTFDDGPEPAVTPWVLDALAQHGAKATFFLLGANAERHPALVQRIRDEGHAVGHHTHSHPNGWRTAHGAYLADAERAHALIGGALFRPPYGRLTPRQAAALRKRFTVVMWDVLSRDYEGCLDPERCLRGVVRHARPGSIVVFHDSLKAWPRLRPVLPAALDHWAREGYRFAALPERPLTGALR